MIGLLMCASCTLARSVGGFLPNPPNVSSTSQCIGGGCVGRPSFCAPSSAFYPLMLECGQVAAFPCSQYDWSLEKAFLYDFRECVHLDRKMDGFVHVGVVLFTLSKLDFPQWRMRPDWSSGIRECRITLELWYQSLRFEGRRGLRLCSPKFVILLRSHRVEASSSSRISGGLRILLLCFTNALGFCPSSSDVSES